MTTEYIHTKEGLVSKKYYFIPKQYIQQFDGDSVWVSLTKDDLKGRFREEMYLKYEQKNFKVNRQQQQKQLQQRLQKRAQIWWRCLGRRLSEKIEYQ